MYTVQHVCLCTRHDESVVGGLLVSVLQPLLLLLLLCTWGGGGGGGGGGHNSIPLYNAQQYILYIEMQVHVRVTCTTFILSDSPAKSSLACSYVLGKPSSIKPWFWQGLELSFCL